MRVNLKSGTSKTLCKMSVVVMHMVLLCVIATLVPFGKVTITPVTGINSLNIAKSEQTWLEAPLSIIQASLGKNVYIEERAKFWNVRLLFSYLRLIERKKMLQEVEA